MKPTHKTPSDFKAWLANRNGQPAKEETAMNKSTVAPKTHAIKRAQQLNELITPDVLAQWRTWRDEGKSFGWIARNCGIDITPNTVRLRMLGDTPPVQEQPRPAPAPLPQPETAVVVQPPTPSVPDWLPADFRERIEAFKRDMQAIGIPVNVGVNIVIVKEIRL